MNTVVFLILHYGDVAVTKACTDSILQLNTRDSIQIVIVDNDYQKDIGEREKLNLQYKDISNINIIRITENIGFSKANNIGYAFAKEHYHPDYIVVTNNDIVFNQTDFVERMKVIQRESNYAVLGPDVIGRDDDSHQSPIDTQGRTLTQVNYTIRMNTICLALFPVVYPLLKWNFQRQKAEQDNGDVECCENVVPSGACIILSAFFVERENQVFSPETTFYYEEYILYEKCKQKGYKIVFDPSVHVLHGDAVATKSKTRNQRKHLRFVMKNTLESAKIYRNMLCDDEKLFVRD